MKKGHLVSWVDEMTDDIIAFNMKMVGDKRIGVKQEAAPLSLEWNIPIEFQTLNVFEYVIDKYIGLTQDLSDIPARDERLYQELLRFQELGLVDVLRTMIYIVHKLTEENVVWGVGRGSSVSSYVLYVIGVHDVDSFNYGLDMNDFLHD
jgi:DNA polymerase III alpha subunit